MQESYFEEAHTPSLLLSIESLRLEVIEPVAMAFNAEERRKRAITKFLQLINIPLLSFLKKL